MNNFVFPIYKSNTVNAYRNTFGQFDKDSLEKKGNFDFCLREEKAENSCWNVSQKEKYQMPIA